MYYIYVRVIVHVYVYSSLFLTIIYITWVTADAFLKFFINQPVYRTRARLICPFKNLIILIDYNHEKSNLYIFPNVNTLHRMSSKTACRSDVP